MEEKQKGRPTGNPSDKLKYVSGWFELVQAGQTQTLMKEKTGNC